MQGLGVEHELATLGLGDRGCDADLAAELVRRPRFTFPDALDLRSVPAVKLPAALALLLSAELIGARERERKGLTQLGVVLGLAPDVAAQPPQAGAQEAELAVVALELFGVGVAPGHQCGTLGDPNIGLTQRHSVLLSLAAKHDDRLVQQPRVRWKGDVLGLHRGVHRDTLQVLRPERAGLVCHRQALLDERQKLLLAQALTPARQRRALEGQPVLEALLAAEELVVGVLKPARAQRLVRQIVHVLEDQQPSHQPARQRRLSAAGAAHRAETTVEKAPVDLPR